MARRLLLPVIALVACRARAPQSAPVTDPIAAWLASIPPACRAEPPITPVQCHTPLVDPPGACIVEQRDLETDTVVDRFVFEGMRLVRADQVQADILRTTKSLAYDSHDRLVRERSCMTKRGGPVGWSPTWRSITVHHTSPGTLVTVAERSYATPTSRVPAFSTTTSTTSTDGKLATSEFRRCYAYDARGRRLRRFEVYRDATRPEVFASGINSYDYVDAGVATIIHRALTLDRHTDGSLAGRFENEWTTSFTYNAQGLVAAVEAAGSKTTSAYDARGRLTNHGGARLAWDDAGRLAAITNLGAGADRDYRYDAGGRLDEVRFAGGGGYRVTYGAGCLPTFTHPAFTPNTDSYLFYEGKDTL